MVAVTGLETESTNQMECPSSVNHSIGNHALIKTGQLAIVCASKREEITIRDVSGIQKTRCVHMLSLEQRYVIWPKCVAWQLAK